MNKKRILFVFLVILIPAVIRQLLFSTPKMPIEKTVLTNEKNEIFSNTQLKDVVSIVSFYQTWCGDCRAEQPQLLELKKQYGDKLQVVMVSDEDWDKVEKMRTYLHSEALSFYKSEKALKSIGVHRFPTTYLVDKQGKVRLTKVEGKDWTTPEIKKIIESLLAK